jgi:hypothetical protein
MDFALPWRGRTDSETTQTTITMSATLSELKQALRDDLQKSSLSTSISLSDAQYSAGFQEVSFSPKHGIYADFVLPQLRSILTSITNDRLSILEIGPGPDSVLTHLPYDLRNRIESYTAYEPNHLFVETLKTSLEAQTTSKGPLPNLRSAADIHDYGFNPETTAGKGECDANDDATFDVILFCHSLYGLKPQHAYIEKAIGILAQQSSDSVVVVFHRDGVLELGNLVCRSAVIYPQGIVSVEDSDMNIDRFAQFIAGCAVPTVSDNQKIRAVLRQTCRDLGTRSSNNPSQLDFSSPDVYSTFSRSALALPELLASVPSAPNDYMVKNREARLHRSAAVVRPTTVAHVQDCVRWALKHNLTVTIIGGGHGGQCLWSNFVAVDMSAFTNVSNVQAHESTSPKLVVVSAGCNSGDIIGKTKAVGLTVPLGSRPSVGAGFWLQGGLGHLARLRGLSCESIVGAVVVGASSGEIWHLGHVPDAHLPATASKPANETELLWAIKGAGTNFSIVISVLFKTCKTSRYLIRNWILPAKDSRDAELGLQKFYVDIANPLPRDCSADAYLFWENGKLQLGIAFCEVLEFENTQLGTTPIARLIITMLGPD